MKTEEHTHAHDLDCKISLKDGKGCEKILKIEVAGDAIAGEFESYYQSIAPKARIPGFRPGKAPRHVLEMHFKGDAREEVLKHLITESYRQAIREKSLEPLGMPDIEDVQFTDNKLSFQAKIEVRPKVKLSKVTGLSVKKEKVEIKKAELDEALERLRESQAKYKAVEDRAAKKGDFVIADYTCTVEGKEIEKRQDDWFEIREDDFLKGFSEQLEGVKPGEDKTIQVSFPENFGRKEVAGKPATFQVKVKEIKTKDLPELNDDLAQAAGEFKTIAELREKIEKDMREYKEREADGKYEKALLDELAKQNKFDLPEALILRRRDRMMEEAMENFKARGGKEDKLAEHREQMLKDFEGEARRQVHIAFLLEIAQQQNIQVSDEDLKARYEKVAAEVRQPVEAVEKYYAGHEDALESMKDQVRSEKAIEYVKQNAKKTRDLQARG